MLVRHRMNQIVVTVGPHHTLREAARARVAGNRACALRSVSPGAVLEEAEKALARGVRVRLAAYSPSSLTRIDLPAPVMCPELRHDLHADLVLVARGTRVLDG